MRSSTPNDAVELLYFAEAAPGSVQGFDIRRHLVGIDIDRASTVTIERPDVSDMSGSNFSL